MMLGPYDVLETYRITGYGMAYVIKPPADEPGRANFFDDWPGREISLWHKGELVEGVVRGVEKYAIDGSSYPAWMQISVLLRPVNIR